MTTRTTCDHDYMKDAMGLPPANVDDFHYFNVSIEPVLFVMKGEVGKDETWTAIHTGATGWDPLNTVEIEGRCIERKKGQGDDFPNLLAAWRNLK